MAKSHLERKHWSIRIVASALIILSLFSIFLKSSFDKYDVDAEAEFHFIDVGQGDASMILTDEGCVVIDCGPTKAGEKIKNYIGRYTDRIDCLVISHAHEDHMGSASTVLESFEIGEVIMTSFASDSSFFARSLDIIEEKDIPVVEAVFGETYIYGDIALRCIAPSRDLGDLNNNSIVMRAEVGNASAVFTGDIENEAEEILLTLASEYLPCDILKVPHHGSSSSSTAAFLDTISPRFAVISCGTGNSYGHPHLEVTDRLQERNIEYRRTDNNGDVVFKVTSNGIELCSSY